MASDSLSALPITRLKGVGPAAAERLAKLGLHSLEDVLFHLPFRYEDRTRITPIGGLRPETGVVIEGQVMAADVGRQDDPLGPGAGQVEDGETIVPRCFSRAKQRGFVVDGEGVAVEAQCLGLAVD